MVEIPNGTYPCDSNNDRPEQDTSSKNIELGCAHCVSTFNEKGNLITHLNLHFEDPLVGDKVHKCDICESYFTNKSLLQTHVTANHENCVKGPITECKCGESFQGIFAYTKHRRIAHGKYNALQNLTSPTCPNYEDAFKGKNCYRNNVKSHTPVNPEINKCGDCGKTYTNKNAYYRHIKTHKEASHKCSVCSKLFHRKGVLQKHIQTHEGIKDFKCLYCGANFTNKDILKKHILAIHPIDSNVQEQLHKCPQCDSFYRKKNHLMHHISKMHMDTTEPTTATAKENILKCASSNQQRDDLLAMALDSADIHLVSKPGILKAEIVIANEKKYFRCDFCEYSDIRFSNLERHMTSHSNTKPYKCTLCEIRFKHLSNLRAHLKSTHEIKCKVNDNRILWKEIHNLASDVFTKTSNKKRENKTKQTKCKEVTTENIIDTKKCENINLKEMNNLIDSQVLGLSMPLLENSSEPPVLEKQVFTPESISLNTNRVVTNVLKELDATTYSQCCTPETTHVTHSETEITASHYKDAVLGQANVPLINYMRKTSNCVSTQSAKPSFIETPLTEDINIYSIDHFPPESELNDISLLNMIQLNDVVNLNCNDALLEEQRNINLIKSSEPDIMVENQMNNSAVSGNSERIDAFTSPLNKKSKSVLDIGTSNELDLSLSSLNVSFDVNDLSFHSNNADISLTDINLDGGNVIQKILNSENLILNESDIINVNDVVKEINSDQNKQKDSTLSSIYGLNICEQNNINYSKMYTKDVPELSIQDNISQSSLHIHSEAEFIEKSPCKNGNEILQMIKDIPLLDQVIGGLNISQSTDNVNIDNYTYTQKPVSHNKITSSNNSQTLMNENCGVKSIDASNTIRILSNINIEVIDSLKPDAKSKIGGIFPSKMVDNGDALGTPITSKTNQNDLQLTSDPKNSKNLIFDRSYVTENNLSFQFSYTGINVTPDLSVLNDTKHISKTISSDHALADNVNSEEFIFMENASICSGLIDPVNYNSLTNDGFTELGIHSNINKNLPAHTNIDSKENHLNETLCVPKVSINGIVQNVPPCHVTNAPEERFNVNYEQFEHALNPNLLHKLDNESRESRCLEESSRVDFQLPDIGKDMEELQGLTEFIKERVPSPNHIDYPYKCKLCAASFVRPPELRKHEKIHSRNLTYLCDLCGKKYTSKSAMVKHWKDCGHSQSVLCSVCGKIIKEVSLYRHPCNISSKIKCLFCGDSFKTKAAKLKHIRKTHLQRPRT